MKSRMQSSVNTLTKVVPDSYDNPLSIESLLVSGLFVLLGVVSLYLSITHAQPIQAVISVMVIVGSFAIGPVIIQTIYATFVYTGLNFGSLHNYEIFEQPYVPLRTVLSHLVLYNIRGKQTPTVVQISQTGPPKNKIYVIVFINNLYGVLQFSEKDLVGPVKTNSLSSGVARSAVSCISCSEFGEWRHGFADHPNALVRNRHGITLCDECIESCFEEVPETLEEKVRVSVMARCI